MRKIRLHYSPTQANRVLVAKLEKVPKIIRTYTFVPLAEEWNERKPQLEKIARTRTRKVFLWGDGTRHHESYYFTRKSGVRLKINVDYHNDVRTRKPADYGSHMRCTKDDGVQIITPEQIVSYSGLDPNKRPTRLEKFLAKTRREGKKFGTNEVALTIDLDGLVGLPVFEEWVYHDGLQPKQVAELIRSLGTRIFRLDIGGLTENMPEFEIVQIDKIPGPLDVMRYLSVIGESLIDPKNKPLIDFVSSYTLSVYVKILEVYAEAIEEK